MSNNHLLAMLRRGRAASSGGGGSESFGAGPNAPAWSGKTVHPVQLFEVPIPVHYAGPDAAGFKGYQGFDGAWDGGPQNPSRVTYPTVSTPIGTKPVLQVRYAGQTHTLSTVGASTPVWTTASDWGVRVQGTFTGTLVFERSLDGGTTWAPVTLRGIRTSTEESSATGSSTTVPGGWVTDTDFSNQLDGSGQFRVRCTALSSGAVQVSVGLRGGEAAARFAAGDFGGYAAKVYTRLLIRNSANWSDGGNTGTKGFFFVTDSPLGHYTGLFSESGLGAFVGLQNSASPGLNRNMAGGATVPKGSWGDFEFVFIANTPGVSNGVARVWLNGSLVLDETDVLYFPSGWSNPGFSGFFMDPTYGGGEAPPPDDINFQIAGWYRESAS